MNKFKHLLQKLKNRQCYLIGVPSVEAHGFFIIPTMGGATIKLVAEPFNLREEPYYELTFNHLQKEVYDFCEKNFGHLNPCVISLTSPPDIEGNYTTLTIEGCMLIHFYRYLAWGTDYCSQKYKFSYEQLAKALETGDQIV